MQVTTGAFPDGGRIPAEHTCDGADACPILVVTGTPEDARFLHITVEDLDARGRHGGHFVHWFARDIPLPTPVPGSFTVDTSAPRTVELNDFGKRAYTGPCPPRGSGVHRYVWRVTATNVPWETPDTMVRLGEGKLTGIYERLV